MLTSDFPSSTQRSLFFSIGLLQIRTNPKPTLDCLANGVGLVLDFDINRPK
jgi:hypothetical protein